MLESRYSEQSQILPSSNIRQQFPAKIQVEVTTRCNMSCSMCVKYAEGSEIVESDLKLESFKKLGSALEHCEVLILNGIGEPLLHPDLAEMAAFARERMPENGSIGFQTNGLLITEAKADLLVKSGVDTFCISVDSLDEDEGGLAELHGQSSVERLSRAFGLLAAAGRKNERKVKLGVEFVLMADTYEQLPGVTKWAAEQGAEFIVCSHVFAYDKSMQDQSLFNPNTPAAYKVFGKWKERASKLGLDLHNYFNVIFKFIKSEEDRKLAALVKDMLAEAKEQDIWMHFRSLLEWDNRSRILAGSHVIKVCAEAESIADGLGIGIRMPPLMASDELSCRFIEEKTAFVTSQGDISPCQFLWHGFTCYMDDSEKVVKPKLFGNLDDNNFGKIWSCAEYTEFRNEVLEYEYPYCSNCSLVPCEDIIGRAYDFDVDCFGVKVPCGHCPWSMGGLQCLL